MKLSPMQRAYLMGARRARAQREGDELAERFEDTFAEIHAEMRGVRSELARLRMLDHAADIDAERDPTMPRWLN